MKYYAGLDVSMKETAVCIVNQEGEIVYESMQPSDPESIACCLKNTELEITKVGLESGSITRWLTLELRKEGINAIAIDARRMSSLLKFNINKNDANDARGIADAMRANMYLEVYVKSDESSDLNALLSTRSSLVGQRVKLMLTIRGHLKSVGIRPGNFSYKNANIVIKPHLDTISPVLRSAIQALLSTLHHINREVDALEVVIRKETSDTEEVKLLRTIPGVGPVIAAAFIAEIEDPLRFKNSRAVPAYLGLTPRLYESGEIHIMGRISKQGRSSLRSLLYQAAHLILTRTTKWSKLKAWGLRILRKHGLKKASVAVARKLAVIMHRMLITKEKFVFGEEPEKKRQTSTKKSLKTNKQVA